MSRVFRLEERKVRPVFIPAISLEEKRDELKEDLKAQADQTRRNATELLARAREEAAEILKSAREKAQQEAARALEKAKAQGYQEGYRQGYESGLAAAQTYVEEAEKALSSARELFDQMLQEKEPEILALCLEIASKIVGESLRQDSELILGIVKQAMDSMRSERHFSIQVNPRFVAILEGQKDFLMNQYGAKSVEVVADDTMGDGAIVKTPHGSVDARVETQIVNIARALKEAMSRSGECR